MINIETWALAPGSDGIAIPHGLCKYVAGWCDCALCIAARDAHEARLLAMHAKKRGSAALRYLAGETGVEL